MTNELPRSKLRGIESVILACPESFCIKEGFPTSGNDKQDKNIYPDASIEEFFD
jgi:hypothetical protein